MGLGFRLGSRLRLGWGCGCTSGLGLRLGSVCIV